MESERLQHSPAVPHADKKWHPSVRCGANCSQRISQDRGVKTASVVSVSLSLAVSLGLLTCWSRRLQREIFGKVQPPQVQRHLCVQYFRVSRHWYGYQCLGFSTYALLLMLAIAHSGCSDTCRGFGYKGVSAVQTDFIYRSRANVPVKKKKKNYFILFKCNIYQSSGKPGLPWRPPFIWHVMTGLW